MLMQPRQFIYASDEWLLREPLAALDSDRNQHSLGGGLPLDFVGFFSHPILWQLSHSYCQKQDKAPSFVCIDTDSLGTPSSLGRSMPNSYYHPNFWYEDMRIQSNQVTGGEVFWCLVCRILSVCMDGKLHIGASFLRAEVPFMLVI